jgi:hypothetical protein
MEFDIPYYSGGIYERRSLSHKNIEGTPIKRVHFSKKKSIPAISRIVNL